jgi:predicted GH43/DUF377 family glycosyl hydrolase
MEWPDGCEIPRMVEGPDGTYYLYYDGWNKIYTRLIVATSKDLLHWTKRGPAFAKPHDNANDFQYEKSAAVLTELKNGRLVAAKINGKYWMYWGVDRINVATSDNLLDWSDVRNPDGSLLKLLSKRPGKFDEQTIEGGVVVLTSRGIVNIFNTFRYIKDANGGQLLAAGLGQALIDRGDPTHVLDRSEIPFLVPDREYEIQGAVNNVVFATGLVFFKGNWMLYHNGGDRMMCVAVASAR